MLDLKRFPEYFKEYNWNAKHSLYGYPADAYGRFEWINSIERRFNWLKHNCESERTASIYLLKEMIQWGGSQNGTLQKFEDGIEQCNLHQLILDTVNKLNNPELAIEAALKIPGMGLTYASKMLRFFEPERYGALDSRIRRAFIERSGTEVLPTINDSSGPSMVKGYVEFTNYIYNLIEKLNTEKIMRPVCELPVGPGSAQWRSADIEMALFGWASSAP